MKRDAKPVSQARRAFLRNAAVCGGAAAACGAVPGAVAAAPDVVGETTPAKPKGYRLTRHVLDYYKSAAD
jgi:hypothetical protein